MSMFHNVLPELAQALLIAVLATVMLGRFVKDARQRMGAVAVLVVLGLFLPVSGLSLAQWLRSVVGDLSILTLVMFLNILAQHLFNHKLLASATRNNLLLGVILVGMVFYPLALGVSEFDPYRLGYAPVSLTVILSLASIIAWTRAKQGMALILLLPLIAFNLQLLESANLWDYLLDPVLLVYALAQSALNMKLSRARETGAQ